MAAQPGHYYPGPQQGYQPVPQYYPSPQQYQPHYPGPAQHQSHSSNVVVVTQPSAAPTVQTTYVDRNGPNHILHCVITFFCPWWIFIWIIICCIYGC